MKVVQSGPCTPESPDHEAEISGLDRDVERHIYHGDGTAQAPGIFQCSGVDFYIRGSIVGRNLDCVGTRPSEIHHSQCGENRVLC